MWGQFVDHVVDTAYSRACTADADVKVGATVRCSCSAVAFTVASGVKLSVLLMRRIILA
jgi:hypothetical protein